MLICLKSFMFFSFIQHIPNLREKRQRQTGTASVWSRSVISCKSIANRRYQIPVCRQARVIDKQSFKACRIPDLRMRDGSQGFHSPQLTKLQFLRNATRCKSSTTGFVANSQWLEKPQPLNSPQPIGCNFLTTLGRRPIPIFYL